MAGPGVSSSVLDIESNDAGKAQTRLLSPTKQKQTPRSWHSIWLWEMLGWVISMVSFVAIVIVLRHYNGRPMPDWPYGITLNAVLSIISTVMKATLAFAVSESLGQLKWPWFYNGNSLSDLTLLDSATRGVMGACVFLLRTLPRHLFTLGCLILALTVATDPFIQQAIIIKERLVPADGLSSIKICDASLYNDSIPGPGPGLNKVSLVTLGALYSGLFQNRGSQDMTAGMECSTGNCTFDTYQSLEICSSCTDITDLLDHSTKNHPLTTGREDIYKLSNGISLSTFQGEPVIMNASSYMGLLRLNVGTAAIITNLTAISLPIESAFSDNPQAHATECTFFFCIKAYDTVVQEAQLSENQIQVSTSSNTTASVEYVLQNFVLTPDTCYFNNTRIQDPHDNYENCVYKVDPFSRLALGNSISPLLNGTAISMNTYRQIWSDNLEALYGTAGNFSQIESTVKSIARALSINARTSICNSKVKGTAWTNQSFVHVRWQWLALPAALMAMGLSFLAFTVVKTRTQYIWKSSPLALLFLHLSNEPSPFPESDPTLNTMEQNANDSRVCLETSSEGIIFRPTSKSE